MSISGLPSENWLLPLFWATVDGSMAGGLNESQPALLVGQAFCTGADDRDIEVRLRWQRHDRA